jgi:hypothetical protein
LDIRIAVPLSDAIHHVDVRLVVYAISSTNHIRTTTAGMDSLGNQHCYLFGVGIQDSTERRAASQGGNHSAQDRSGVAAMQLRFKVGQFFSPVISDKLMIERCR